MICYAIVEVKPLTSEQLIGISDCQEICSHFASGEFHLTPVESQKRWRYYFPKLLFNNCETVSQVRKIKNAFCASSSGRFHQLFTLFADTLSDDRPFEQSCWSVSFKKICSDLKVAKNFYTYSNHADRVHRITSRWKAFFLERW